MLLQGVGLLEILGNVIMRIKIRNICSIHLIFTRPGRSQNLWRAVAEKIHQWTAKWRGSDPLWGWGLWEGHKIIDHQGTDIFLSLIILKRLARFGAQSKNINYILHETLLSEAPHVSTWSFIRTQAFYNSPYYPEKCNIFVGAKSRPPCISLYHMPILTIEPFWPFPHCFQEG